MLLPANGILSCTKERAHWELADTFSEMMYILLETDYREGKLDLDSGMKRLKDLSAYSLTHAEIMVQREGVELLALAKFFGLIGESRFHKNRERLYLLSEETFAYQGQAEKIEREIKERGKRTPPKAKPQDLQHRLL
jgi:hypothetical protein